jgi:hypothetical protein
MKFTPGIAITEARGSFQATTFTRNASGAVIRSRVKPINRRSTSQSLVRQQFGSIASSWRGLTQTQRDSWEAAKSSFPYQDTLGQTKIYTASQLYEKFNRNILAIGGTIIATAPSPASFDIYTLAVSDTDTDALAITIGPNPIPATDSVILYATRPVSAGRNTVGQSDFRQLDVLLAADTPPQTIVTAYEAVFGSLAGLGGQKVFIQIRPVKTASGIAAVPLRAQAILTTPA